MTHGPAPTSLTLETIKHTSFAILISILICALVYAVVDPSLFQRPVAVLLPVICPLLAAPPIVRYLLKSRSEMADAKAVADTHARRLQAMAEEKDRVLSLVGHDLAGQMGIISSFANALGQPQVTDADRFGQANEILQAAALAQDVLREMMTWGRLTIADEETQRSPVDGRLLIDQVVELTRGLAAAKGIFMEGIGRSMQVSADRRQIEGALRNLVGNAIQHTPRDGTIVLSIEKLENGRISFTVRDNGNGIRPDILAALRRGEALNIFKRGSTDPDDGNRPSDTARALRGTARSTGLGLALCREVAERHGGTLAIDSSPGSGTTVSLSIST